MRDHSVVVDESGTPRGVEFADIFNVSVAFLDRHLDEGRGDKPFLVTRGASWSIGEIAGRANRTANAFKALGIGPGDRVMLFCKDGPGFYDGFLGAARIGAVAIPVNYFLRAADYAYMLKDSGARAVMAHADMFGEVEPALAEAGEAVRHRICVDADAPGWLSHEALLAASDPWCPPEPTTPRTDCFWLYSSGSTGDPKASVHQHKDQVYTSVLYAEAVAGMTADDVLFSPPKMFFAYGLGNSVSFPFWTGATTIYLEGRPTAENTLDTITEFKPSVYFGVPTLYAMQLAAMEAGHEAGPLQSALGGVRRRGAAGFGVRGLEGAVGRRDRRIYRLERGAALSTPPIRRAGSGRARLAPSCRATRGASSARTARTCRTASPASSSSRGESIATYYWNKPERTARGMRDGGWFHTGDTCYRDGDGYYYFCGRDDDMLKVGGIWVAPFEVESALAAHPGVLEAAVVGAEGRERAGQAQGVCRAQGARRRGPPAGGRAGRFRPRPARALQIPALDRVRRRAAQDRVRQDPAFPAARRIEEKRDGRCLGLADEVRCGHALDQHHRAAALRRDGAQGGDQPHLAHAHPGRPGELGRGFRRADPAHRRGA